MWDTFSLQLFIAAPHFNKVLLRIYGSVFIENVVREMVPFCKEPPNWTDYHPNFTMLIIYIQITKTWMTQAVGSWVRLLNATSVAANRVCNKKGPQTLHEKILPFMVVWECLRSRRFEITALPLRQGHLTRASAVKYSTVIFWRASPAQLFSVWNSVGAHNQIFICVQDFLTCFEMGPPLIWEEGADCCS
jgi:hypothetical protein